MFDVNRLTTTPIELTQDMINDGRPNSCQACPMTIALDKAFETILPNRWEVYRTDATLSVGARETATVALDMPIREMIKSFDNRNKQDTMKPCNIRIREIEYVSRDYAKLDESVQRVADRQRVNSVLSFYLMEVVNDE